MKPRRRLAALATLLALSAAGTMVPITADAASQSVIVSSFPIENAPRVLNGSIFAIAEAGPKIIVGGSFTSVRNWDSPVAMTRNHIFAFDAATGAIDPAFSPNFDKEVNAIVTAADGQVFVGGAFKSINGVTRKGLVKMSTADGAIDPGFKAQTNRDVNDMALTGTRLVIGGRFSKIRNVPRGLLGAVDATTGAVLDLDLPVTQTRNRNTPYIQELDVSPDGTRLAIVGNFISVGGLLREQIALIDLTASPPTVANWATTRYHQDCAPVYNNTYMRDVAFSPDSQFFIAVTTGAFWGINALCDVSARWETGATGTNLQPTWVTHTGGDTNWHVLITDAAAYVGGHQRWQNNPYPSPRGDNDGPGSVSRQGIAALDPLTGVPLSWNPGRHRGAGVESFLATADRLYVGSDTEFFAGTKRERLAVLPVAGGIPNPLPDVPTLPVELYWARGDLGGNLYRGSFDGSALTGTTLVNGPSSEWLSSTHRDGFVQKEQLFSFGAASAFYKRNFDGTGPVTNLSTSVGYVDENYNLTPYDQPYGVNTTRAAAYHQGRIYYTRTDNSQLYWRWFSLESGIIGAQQYVANSGSWTGVTGLEIVGEQLYASWSDNRLYKVAVNGAVVASPTTRVLVNDGNVAGGIPWGQVRGLFVRD